MPFLLVSFLLRGIASCEIWGKKRALWCLTVYSIGGGLRMTSMRSQLPALPGQLMAEGCGFLSEGLGAHFSQICRVFVIPVFSHCFGLLWLMTSLQDWSSSVHVFSWGLCS
jgi:hypothetical protein